MPVATLATLFEAFGAQLLVLALASARFIALVNVFPAFTRLGLAGLARTAVAVVLALPLLPAIAPDAAATVVAQPPLLAMLMVKEAAVGAGLGLLYGIPFWAAESAGDLIDHQRGSEAALSPDPSGATESTPYGTLLVLVLLVLFFAGGGLPIALEGFYASHRVWPAVQLFPASGRAAGTLALLLLDRLLRLAFVLAAPIVLALLLAELALGLIGRIAPQLNVFELALTVKSLVAALLMPLYALFVVGHLREHLAGLAELPATFDGLLRP
jgi:type III secretion protein T